ncbi:MAG: glycosyltransferase [Chthoniobacterales bacterium]|nr:glycosyltransferase [Chthoniobacterales bacterium]
MTESEHPEETTGSGHVAVVVPLFPRLPGLRQSLASLGTQTRPPDLVILLDDGKTPDVEKLRAEIPHLASEILQTGMETVPSAINAAVSYLANFEFITFLQAGDQYTPERIEHCLAALRTPLETKQAAMVISGIEATDSRGNLLTAEDSRVQHLARLWAPASSGVTAAEWLGIGNIAATASNVFTRREALAEEPLPEIAGYFPYLSTVSAAVQGTLAILPHHLLRHNPVAQDHQASLRTTPELLRAQMHLLAALRDKLATSPETRHNLAAFHRASWNNLSGLREDLFQQAVLRAASAARPEDIHDAVSGILRSHAAQSLPAHQSAMMEGADPLDFAAYIAALARTREQLDAAETENRRLHAIANAAQGSGWVRFGAWLGERSARRMMEMEADDETSPTSNDAGSP